MSIDYTSLQAGLRGELIQPGDAGYDDARKLYNGMIDKKPRLIARCVDAADVMACVNYARESGMLLAVRGGGHNGPGLGSCDDGLVIDLSRMRGVKVDPQGEDRPGGWRKRVGGRRSRYPCLRDGHAERHYLHHGRGWFDPWRRHWTPLAKVWPEYRQPARGRYGPGRRDICHGQPGSQRGSLLGDPRWRRQLRGGHVLHFSAAPGRHGDRRPDVLAHRRLPPK